MVFRARKPVVVSALIVAALALAWFLFAWFGFEPLVKWGLPKMVADKSGHRLAIEQARLDPLRLAVVLRGVSLDNPQGKRLLALNELFLDIDAASLPKRAVVLDEIRLGEPVVLLELRADGRSNWLDFAAAFAGDPKSGPGRPLRLLLRRCIVEKGRIEFVDELGGAGFRTRIDPLDVELRNVSSLPDDRGDYALSAHTGIGANLRWKGSFSLDPLVATGEVAVDTLLIDRLWPYLENRVSMAPPRGTAALSLAYRASYANGRFDLALDRLEASIDKLALGGVRDAAPSIALDSLRVGGGRVDLARKEVALDSVQVEGGRLAVELDAGRPTLLDWLAPPPAAASAAASAASAPAGLPWRLAIGKVGVDGVAVGVVDRSFAAPLTSRIGRLQLQFKAQAAFGAGAPEVAIDGLGLRIADLGVASAPSTDEWLRMASLELQDGSFGLAAREIALGRLALKEGHVEIARDARGGISLLDALKRSGARAAAPPRAPAGAQSERPWRYRIGKVELDEFSLALREESVTPPARLAIEGLSAAVDGVSDDLAAELPVRLQFRVEQGGTLKVDGRVSPAAPSAELRIDLADLALMPAQPFLAQRTNLVLADGTMSTQGLLHYRGGKPAYDGSFAVRRLQLKEAGTDDPILGWRSLSSTRAAATQDGLRIGDLVLDGLVGKLVVFKDRTVNIARLLEPASKADAASSPAPVGPERKAPYRVDVERVRIDGGEMDFADLSLALPFGARIHDLKGHLIGLSSAPGAAAQLEFDGKVDEFGLARAVGQIKLFDPTGFTEIKVLFRNVEMTALTPYSATFAGRKIESGKLSLDLDYKIRERQLAGDNQIVMEKLTLGEKVESPTAMNLPLDLALAILQDADGRIDLGLPVQGSLDDPKFSYGQIIWKAIVNVVTKIVTAPFRALGAMLGVSGEKLDAVAFDDGSAELLPPEQEKLSNISKLLAKRPAVALSVRADYDPAADGKAIKELRLRRAVAQDAGRQLADLEDPGPISTAQPATCAALEHLYAKRYGADALESLMQRYRQANPEPPPPTVAGRLVSRLSPLFKAQAKPLSADETARLQGADVHALMMQRLLDDEAVDDGSLRALAARRHDAIEHELVARGVPAERIRAEAPQARAGEGGVVSASLSIAVGHLGPAAAPAARLPAASAEPPPR